MSPSEPGSVASVDRDNPWPGLTSFTEDLRGFFHGRDEEIVDLTQLAERRPLVVLFGQSGLGKSSLLQAGVFPRLRTDGFCPVYVRLDHAEGAPPPTAQIKELVRIETAKVGQWTKPNTARPDETLWEFFHHRDDRLLDRDGLGVVPVLVFDQFEELFTLGAGRGERRERAVAFIKELAELVENRPPAELVARLEQSSDEMEAFDFGRTDYRVIISLREDFLPDLESLKTIMPALMQKRMRLARMTGKQALEAVMKPGGAFVTEEVGRAIVEFVAGTRGGSAERMLEMEVEPALLSVICRELNERRRANGQAQITADLVSGNRREILSDFYERSVADLPEAMRRFVEDKLLTKSGFRDNLALETALEEPGVTKPLIDTLVAGRLLRIEDRIGTQRVELTHDVLAEVIRAARDDRQQRTVLLAVARRARRQRWVIAGLAAAVVALLIGAFFGLRAQRRAEKLARDEAAQSSRTDFILGSRLLEENKTPEGLAYLVRAAKSDRTNHSIGPRLLSALAYRSFAEPIGKPIVGDAPFTSMFYLNDRCVLTGTDRGSSYEWACWDLATGRKLRTFDFGVEIGIGSRHLIPRFSPDGHLHAAVDREGTITVSETETGRRVGTPLHHQGSLLWLVFSPDNRWLVTSTTDEKVYIWDLASGQLKASFPYPNSGYGALAISHDSRRLVTTGGHLRFWQLPEGIPLTEELEVVAGSPKAFGGLAAFTPDGKYLVVVQSGGLQFYDGNSGQPVGERMAHGGQTTDLRFSNDGTKLVSFSSDGNAKLWEVPSGRALHPPLQHGADVTRATFTFDDRYLVTRTGDGMVRVWSVATGQLALEPIRGGDAFCGDVHPSRSEIIVSANDGSVRRWQIAPSAAKPMEIPADPNLRAIYRNTQGLLTAWSIYPTRMQKIDLLTGAQIGNAIEFPVTIKGALLAPNEQLLAVRTDRESTELWQLGGPKIVQRVLGQPSQSADSLGYRFSPDSSFLARGYRARDLTVWDTKTGEIAVGPLEVLGMPNSRHLFPFSTTSRSFIVENNTARNEGIAVVDLVRRKVSAPIHNGGTAWAVTLSPDEKTVAVGNSTGVVQIWDIAANQPVGAPFVPRRSIIRGAAFDRSGTRLLTWNRLEVYLWDVATRKRVLPIMPAGTDVITAVFSPDEKRIASFATTRGEIRIFDVATGALLGEPLLGAHATNAVPTTFSADGRFILSSTPLPAGANTNASTNGLYVWPVPPPSSGQPLPDWLLEIASAVAGGELDRNGTLQERTPGPDVFEHARTALAALPADAPYAEWGRWILADRATRPMGPGLKITAAELEKRREAARAATVTTPPP